MLKLTAELRQFPVTMDTGLAAHLNQVAVSQGKEFAAFVGELLARLVHEQLQPRDALAELGATERQILLFMFQAPASPWFSIATLQALGLSYPTITLALRKLTQRNLTRQRTGIKAPATRGPRPNEWSLSSEGVGAALALWTRQKLSEEQGGLLAGLWDNEIAKPY